MILIGKTIQNGKPVLIVETKGWFFKKIREYIAERETITGKYWEWLELPNRTIVDDKTSFQLDAWNRISTDSWIKTNVV